VTCGHVKAVRMKVTIVAIVEETMEVIYLLVLIKHGHNPKSVILPSVPS
jgi:hypothetical protein